MIVLPSREMRLLHVLRLVLLILLSSLSMIGLHMSVGNEVKVHDLLVSRNVCIHVGVS